MNRTIKPDEWLWIIVQNPDGNQQILGQFESEKKISFIPAFKTREDAQNGFLYMQKETGARYEVQAIIAEDLTAYASENSFLLFILDADGQVLQHIDPSENQQ